MRLTIGLLFCSAVALAQNVSIPGTNILAVWANSGPNPVELEVNGQSIPAGDALVMACEDPSSGTATFTPSDAGTPSGSNTWTQLFPVVHWSTSGSPTHSTQWFWVQNTVAMTLDEVTCTGATLTVVWWFHSPTGTISLDATTAFSEHDGGGGSGLTVQITTVNQNDLILGMWDDNNAGTGCFSTDTRYYDITPANLSTNPFLEGLGYPSTGLTNSVYSPDADCYFGSNYIVAAAALREGTGAPVITSTCPLPAGNINSAYSQQLASNDSTATWSLASGSLPNGLALGASGLIVGSPTQAGTANFTVEATNPSGGTDSTLSCSLTINAVQLGPAIQGIILLLPA